jgi:hypothetical protein
MLAKIGVGQTLQHMKLFISHAWEDKVDFVRPLAAALKDHYDVWYDEYELVVGDSLRQKIDAGLKACDFGVVVLSPSFFAKKWPQIELDGLFALETTNRKIILPIWKDVSAEDVKGFSPVLAGRVAAMAANGIAAVFSDIRRAVDVSARTRELLTTDSVMNRVRDLDSSIKDQRQAALLSNSEKGVEIVKKEAEQVVAAIEDLVTQSNSGANNLKFQLRRPNAVARYRDFGIVVQTIYGLHLETAFMNDCVNSIENATLRVAIYRARTVLFGDVETKKIEEILYKPMFTNGERAVWGSPGKKAVQASEELAGALFNRLLDQIERHRTEEG